MHEMQVNADQKEEDESKWAATKGMQYSARGRKLNFSRKQLVIFIMPLVAWMALLILIYGLAYMFIGASIPRLDSVNGGSRVQAYSKSVHCYSYVELLHRLLCLVVIAYILVSMYSANLFPYLQNSRPADKPADRHSNM